MLSYSSLSIESAGRAAGTAASVVAGKAVRNAAAALWHATRNAACAGKPRMHGPQDQGQPHSLLKHPVHRASSKPRNALARVSTQAASGTAVHRPLSPRRCPPPLPKDLTCSTMPPPLDATQRHACGAAANATPSPPSRNVPRQSGDNSANHAAINGCLQHRAPRRHTLATVFRR